jgi:hypothetical protein
MLALLLSAPVKLLSQDTTFKNGVKDKKAVYSQARKASLLSTVLPGAGQIYNKKYWKTPLIYAAFGGLGYFFVSNNNQYNYFRKNLIAEYDENPDTHNNSGFSGSQLQTQKLYYRRFRDFAAIGIGAVYIFNIIDANVDAHLKSFDVSDDLSLKVSPWNTYRNGKMASGISLKINFR